MFKNWQYPGCGFIILCLFVYWITVDGMAECDRHQEAMQKIQVEKQMTQSQQNAQQNAQQMYSTQ